MKKIKIYNFSSFYNNKVIHVCSNITRQLHNRQWTEIIYDYSFSHVGINYNGISGNVTLIFYPEHIQQLISIFSSGIPNQGSNDTITFISNSKSANDVSITSNGDCTYTYNVKNLVIKNITLNAVNGTKRVEITGTCE